MKVEFHVNDVNPKLYVDGKSPYQTVISAFAGDMAWFSLHDSYGNPIKYGDLEVVGVKTDVPYSDFNGSSKNEKFINPEYLYISLQGRKEICLKVTKIEELGYTTILTAEE